MAYQNAAARGADGVSEGDGAPAHVHLGRVDALSDDEFLYQFHLNIDIQLTKIDRIDNVKVNVMFLSIV